MSDKKTTPRPWVVEGDGYYPKIVNQDGFEVCTSVDRPDAILIVQDVNAHEALVLALEMAQADYEAAGSALYHSVGDTEQQRVDCQRRIAVISAALAIARGE
jgi:hypothetical protein